MTWSPFEKKPAGQEVQEGIEAGKKPTVTPPEKTPAELIAESIQSNLQPLISKLDEFGTRLETIEQGAPKRTATPDPAKLPEIASVWDNEDAAFSQRLTPIALRQLEIEARLVKNEIKAEYAKLGFGDMWEQFAAEIDKTLEDTNLVDASGKVLRGNPAYIRNCVDMIFGRAARQAGMKFNAQEKTFFLESAASSTTETHTPEPYGMTPAQRRVFERMGVPLEKAKETIKKLEFVS